VPKSLVAVLVIGLMASVPDAEAVDCRRVRSRVDRAVCGHRALKKLDLQLTEAYRVALESHPVPDAVRARQRRWVEGHDSCPEAELPTCLKRRYLERLAHLAGTPLAVVYASADRAFSFERADLLVEVWPEEGRRRVSLWGGFAIHRQASLDNGRPTFVGCEFEGTWDPATGTATGRDGLTVKLALQAPELRLPEDLAAKVCSGFGRLPEKLVRVGR
jgi:uncharacterized protein YecT (DUF1311 family)